MARTKLKSIGTLFRESSEAVRRNLTLFIFLNTASILGAAWNIGLSIRDKSHSSDWAQSITHSITGKGGPNINDGLVIALFIGGIIFYLLAFFLAVEAADHSHVSFSRVWEVFKNKWWKALATWIMLVVLVIPGLILFIFPGVYLISRLALAPVIVVDQDIRVLDALSTSWKMTEGHAWTIFITAFFGFLLSVPSIIPIVGPLISLILTIAYSVALPIRYFELKRIEG